MPRSPRFRKPRGTPARGPGGRVRPMAARLAVGAIRYNAAMAIPILSTKLYVPPPAPQVVPRPRLLDQFTAGLQGKLTLIAAPAGFGKTTLLSAGVAGCGRPVAWLSLDAEDSDPARFLTYLVAALQTIAPQIGEGVAEALQSSTPLPTDALLTALLNDLTTLPHPFLLVLDDYHVIAAPAVDEALTFLLEHLPPQLHLVLASREDPPLPLARLRARDQLTELRAGDLRFSPTEAAGFLRGDESPPRGGRGRRAGSAHRRLDCRPAISRALPAGPPDVPGFIAGLRGQPPLHRGLSGRGGPAAAARAGPQLPTPDRHSRALARSTVRCRHRAAGWPGAVGSAGARQLLRRAAVFALLGPLQFAPASAATGPPGTASPGASWWAPVCWSGCPACG